MAGPVHAQRAPDTATATPALPGDAPKAFKPDADTDPDVWIFSGALQNTREPFSGTLVARKGEAQFEMTLSGGVRCDGTGIDGEVGLVRLKEITCSDARVMRALFVPQGGQALKVFGHVGEERFVASAHLLGTEPIPEKPQTAEPTVPKVKPPK